MPFRCSTGSAELDSLLEELRPGDNVVFYASAREQYSPFVIALLDHVRAYNIGLVYIRLNGALDDLVRELSGLEIVELADSEAGDPSGALRAKLERLGPHAYYLFDPLDDSGALVPGRGFLARVLFDHLPQSIPNSLGGLLVASSEAFFRRPPSRPSRIVPRFSSK